MNHVRVPCHRRRSARPVLLLPLLKTVDPGLSMGLDQIDQPVDRPVLARRLPVPGRRRKERPGPEPETPSAETSLQASTLASLRPARVPAGPAKGIDTRRPGPSRHDRTRARRRDAPFAPSARAIGFTGPDVRRLTRRRPATPWRMCRPPAANPIRPDGRA